MFDVIYSYDCNVLRAIPRGRGQIECCPFGAGGRKLKFFQLRSVAENEWPERVGSLKILKEGEGFE